MAWTRFKDIENNGFRPMTFTATGTAIAINVFVCRHDTSTQEIRIPATGWVDEVPIGITAEAIAADGTGRVYTSGIFYNATGGEEAINVNMPVTLASADTVQEADSTTHYIWGVTVIADTVSSGASYIRLISMLDVGDTHLHI
jgi:hypothetical protein